MGGGRWGKVGGVGGWNVVGKGREYSGKVWDGRVSVAGGGGGGWGGRMMGRGHCWKGGWGERGAGGGWEGGVAGTEVVGACGMFKVAWDGTGEGESSGEGGGRGGWGRNGSGNVLGDFGGGVEEVGVKGLLGAKEWNMEVGVFGEVSRREEGVGGDREQSSLGGNVGEGLKGSRGIGTGRVEGVVGEVWWEGGSIDRGGFCMVLEILGTERGWRKEDRMGLGGR
ncbi:hypothetical protein Tco_0386459 [Tanacetum coccineum]